MLTLTPEPDTRPLHGGHMSSREFADALDISYRQVDYWCRIGVLAPDIPARGSGTRRRFTPDELRVARALIKLRWLGCTLDDLIYAGHALRMITDWTGYFEWGDGRIIRLDHYTD